MFGIFVDTNGETLSSDTKNSHNKILDIGATQYLWAESINKGSEEIVSIQTAGRLYVHLHWKLRELRVVVAYKFNFALRAYSVRI